MKLTNQIYSVLIALCVRAKNNQVYFQDYIFPRFKGEIVLQTFLKELGQWGLIKGLTRAMKGEVSFGFFSKGLEVRRRGMYVVPQFLAQQVCQSQIQSQPR